MADFLLEQSTWDLIATATGDIAICTEPYATAQEVACECKLFRGEGYYLPLLGIPYNQEILGQAPNMSLLQSLMQTAALNVPGVETAQAVTYLDRTTREAKGVILVSTRSGEKLTVTV